jgi:periplasmic copper chaperone A
MKAFTLLLVSALSVISTPLFANSLTVEDLYIRATPPNSKNTAAFMVIKNSAQKDIKLLAIDTNIADRVELHHHVMEAGLMKMRRVKELAIKPGGLVSLQPGGYHLMLFNLQQPLKEGQSVTLSLSFDNGQQLILDAPIKKIQTQK